MMIIVTALSIERVSLPTTNNLQAHCTSLPHLLLSLDSLAQLQILQLFFFNELEMALYGCRLSVNL